jgi:hypothetical protein
VVDLNDEYLSPLFLCPILKNPTTGKPPQIYETELQLFPKKCEVKLQKHLNHIAGRTETSKNGQYLRSRLEQEQKNKTDGSMVYNRHKFL